MILGIGSDMIDIRRIEQAMERFGDRFLERIEIEAGLGLEAVVEKSANLEEFVNRLVDLLLGAPFGERLDDQGIELRVLSLFLPMVEHQALEERVDVAVVADRAQVMRLAHPLDH